MAPTSSFHVNTDTTWFLSAPQLPEFALAFSLSLCSSCHEQEKRRKLTLSQTKKRELWIHNRCCLRKPLKILVKGMCSSQNSEEILADSMFPWTSLCQSSTCAHPFLGATPSGELLVFSQTFYLGWSGTRERIWWVQSKSGHRCASKGLKNCKNSDFERTNIRSDLESAVGSNLVS